MSARCVVISVAVLALSACGASHSVTHTTTHSAATATSRTATARTPTPHPRHALRVRAMLARWRLPVARYRTVAVANGRYVFLLGGIDAGGATVDTVCIVRIR